MTAFQATWSDFKIVKGRKCAQLIFEVPLEAADAALAVLGGVPRPDQECWVGIARIDPKAKAEPVKDATKEKRRFEELPLPQRIGITCEDARFKRFLMEQHSFYEKPEDFVRDFCGVESRAKISPENVSGAQWSELYSEYQAWLLAP